MQRALVLAALWSAPIIAPVSTDSPDLSSGSPVSERPAVLASSSSAANGVVRDTVVISTSDDMKLSATYFPPQNRKGRAPAALLVHDAGANRGQLDSIAERLQKAGFGVLTVDLRGHGDSKTSSVDWSALDASGQTSLWQLAPRDLKASARWLLERSGVHSTSLSLVGYRSGCALVARHAEQDENVRAMMLMSPKAKDMGFDVKQTILNVYDLPTCFLDQKNAATTALLLSTNKPSPWIDHLLVPSKTPTVLEDSKTPSKVSSWLGGVALPKKGRGR